MKLCGPNSAITGNIQVVGTIDAFSLQNVPILELTG
jgi:hypothetical protein